MTDSLSTRIFDLNAINDSEQQKTMALAGRFDRLMIRLRPINEELDKLLTSPLEEDVYDEEAVRLVSLRDNCTRLSSYIVDRLTTRTEQMKARHVELKALYEEERRRFAQLET